MTKKQKNRKIFADSDSESSNVENSSYDSDSDSEGEAERRRPKGMEPLNDALQKVLDYKTYRLYDKSSCYTKSAAKNVSKAGKRISFQIRGHTFY